MDAQAPHLAPHVVLGRLTDRAPLRSLGYFAGCRTAAPNAANFAVSDPRTGALLARVASLGVLETDAAIAAATSAFPARSDRLPQDRAKVLCRRGDLMIAAREKLSLLMTREQGKPMAEARGELNHAAGFLEWFEGEAPRNSAEMALAFEPTLLINFPADVLTEHEETLGPVAAVVAFDTEAGVITRAGDTDYGLVAYVATKDGARQLRVSRALDHGMVAIIRDRITGGPIPFGGWKQSGPGREGARHGPKTFTELKYLCIDTAA